MTVNRKPNGRAMTLPAGSALGAAFALLWTLISSGFLAWLIHNERLPEEAIGYGSMVILLSASILGALVAYGKVKKQRMLTSACSGGIYLLMLLAITALFFGGKYSGMGVTALLILGGSGTAALLGMRQGKSRMKRGRKIRI